MIRTRLLVTAFLINGERLLMMKRSPLAKLLPGRWAPIGGHIETGEINDPRAACLREIREETGLTPGEVVDLSLRYIVHRRREDEIRIQYVYFGLASEERVSGTEEGELCWVPFDRTSELDVSASTRFTLEHYALHGSRTDCVVGGTLDAHKGIPCMSWAGLRDWQR